MDDVGIDVRIWALLILSAMTVLLGIEGCTANAAYQFRAGHYCSARDTSVWIACDVIKDFRGLP